MATARAVIEPLGTRRARPYRAMNSERAIAWRLRTSSSSSTADMPVPAPKDKPTFRNSAQSARRLTPDWGSTGTRTRLAPTLRGRHASTMTLDQIKRDVAIANRVLWATGLCAGITTSLGHASRRVPDQPDRFVVKGRGYKMDALAAMQPQDMVTCDLEGNLIDGPPGATQCFEI